MRSLVNEIEGGSKKKSTLRTSIINNNYHNLMEESNSKRRISWGGIHTRWFNEQGNQNWDLSPQSLRSGSDKSRSIDASNLTDEKIYDQQQAMLQSLKSYKENLQNNQQDDKGQFKTYDRLSMYFQPEGENNLVEEPLFLPSKVNNNNQENIYRRISSDQQHITGIQKRISSPANTFKYNQRLSYQQDLLAQNDDSQLYNDSESNLLDNIDRMSRLSGLFNDSDINKQNDNSDILLSIKDIQNQHLSSQSNQQNQQKSLQIVQQNNLVPIKESIIFLKDKNQAGFEILNNQNSNTFNIFQNSSNQNAVIQTKTVQDQKNSQNNYDSQQNLIYQNASKIAMNNINNKSDDVNQNLFKNYHEIEKNQIIQQNQNPKDKQDSNKSNKDFKRLSEFFQQDVAKTEQKPNKENNNEKLINEQKKQKQDKMIFDQNFSSVDNHIFDSTKRPFPFSIGFASDIYNESKSIGNDNSSYLMEYLDKVNSLSEINPHKREMAEERGVTKKQTSITPSPLMNDLKSLNLDLEEDTHFIKHVNSAVKIAKEKRVRMREDLEEIKSGDLFSKEMVNENPQQIQSKPKSILTNQKNLPENQGIISKQKVQIKQQLNTLIKNDFNTSGNKLSPKKISISKSILPNSSVQKQIKHISLMPKENPVKGNNPQNDKLESEKNSKQNLFYNSKIQSDNKENINFMNNAIQDTTTNEHIKNTPIRKSNIFNDEEIKTDNSDNLENGIKELEDIVIKMPLNSYEKKVILNFLTPGKKSKNMQLIKESILANHQAKQVEQQVNKEEDISKQELINSQSKQPFNTNNSEKILEQLCNAYQQKISNLQKDVENSEDRVQKLAEITKQNSQLVEKEEEELRRLEEQIQQKRQNQKQRQSEEDYENKIKQLIIQNENKQNVLYQNQYWQTYQIIIHYFGFEYLGKLKDKNNKGDMVAFRFLNKYLCSLQMVKQRQQDKIYLAFIKGFVYSIFNSQETSLISENVGEIEKQFKSYTDLLSSSNIAKITENLIFKKYKNYVNQNGNIIELLQYIGSKLSELEELYRQMKVISNIYSVRSYTYNSQTQAISFTLKLTQFPQKFVKFIISPESWFNEIEILVVNIPNSGTDDIHQKLNEEIDKQINTQFNSKINSQSSYQKLRMIIDAINVKNAIEPQANESNASRLSTSALQQSSQKE